MGRAEDQQEPQEYHHDHHDSDAPAFEAHDNQPAEMGVNFNIDHQASYNVTNPMEPQANIVHEQYPPQQAQQPNPGQYPPPQQANPVQFPPQQNPSQGNPMKPSPSFPPQGSPMQFPTQARSSTQPMQFPPAASQEAPQPYNQQPNYQQPNYGQQAQQPNYGQQAQQPNYGHQAHQFPPQPVPQSPQMGNYAKPQSPFKPAASGIPIQGQFPNAVAQIGTNPWRTGLFDCMDDPQNAIVTACFPCVTFGQIAEIIDNGHTTCATSGIMYGCIAFFIGVPCILSCGYRSKLRSRFGLSETPAPDWVTHCLCEWCALCQEYRELNMRGLDPTIGWQGNLAKNNMMQQQQQMGMTPPMNQNMHY